MERDESYYSDVDTVSSEIVAKPQVVESTDGATDVVTGRPVTLLSHGVVTRRETQIVEANVLPPPATQRTRVALLVTCLRALGIVYGDLVTSPLYTLTSVFADTTFVPSEDQVYGVISLVFWFLTLIVCVKYAMVVMRADYHGEGGTFSLLQLILTRTEKLPRWGPGVLAAVALFMAGMVIGDGIITPAISVVSALEGLIVVSHSLEPYIVPIAVAILFVFFMCQRFGTHKVGSVFGPVLLLWTIVIGMIGTANLIKNGPRIFRALSPHYGILLLGQDPRQSLNILGTAVLCVTGVEAMYADMGHFGDRPIRWTWLILCYPCLVLQYLGQGSHLLLHPEDGPQIFFRCVPTPVYWPVLVLATMATVVASQSIVTGCFTVISEAVSLQYFPHVHIVHTSKSVRGQVYCPEACYVMMVLCLAIVAGFKTSPNMANMFGVAVTSVMLATTLLILVVLRIVWNRGILFCVLFGGTYLVIDGALWVSNIVKLQNGGYVPVIFGTLLALIMNIWRMGVAATTAANVAQDKAQAEGFLTRQRHDPSFASAASNSTPSVDTVATFLEMVSSGYLPRAERTRHVAVFLSPVADGVPLVARRLLQHTDLIPEWVVFLTVRFLTVPFVADKDRVKVHPLAADKHGPWLHQVELFVGFSESSVVTSLYQEIIGVVTQIYGRVASVESHREGTMFDRCLRSCRRGDHRDQKRANDSWESNEDDYSRDDRMRVSIFVAQERVLPRRNSSLLRRCWIAVYDFLALNSMSEMSFFKLPPGSVVQIVVKMNV